MGKTKWITEVVDIASLGGWAPAGWQAVICCLLCKSEQQNHQSSNQKQAKHVSTGIFITSCFGPFFILFQAEPVSISKREKAREIYVSIKFLSHHKGDDKPPAHGSLQHVKNTEKIIVKRVIKDNSNKRSETRKHRLDPPGNLIVTIFSTFARQMYPFFILQASCPTAVHYSEKETDQSFHPRPCSVIILCGGTVSHASTNLQPGIEQPRHRLTVLMRTRQRNNKRQ